MTTPRRAAYGCDMEFHLQGVVDGRPVSWPLLEGATRIGRSTDVPVSLPDRSVSREHAVLTRTGDTLEIEDLGSRNGTTINGERLEGRRTLKGGEEISIGNIQLKILGASGPDMQPTLSEHGKLDSTLKLEWNDVRSLPPGDIESSTPLFDVITDLGEFLVQQQPAQQLYDLCLTAVEKLVPFQRACLLLLDAEGNPELKASRIQGRGTMGALALSRTIVDSVITERASLLVQDALHDARFGSAHSVILQQIRSALVVPLFDNLRVIGVLYADTRELVSPYTPEHLRRLALLANILAVKISNSRLLEAEREKERMALEMATAARIQRALLPQSPPIPAGYELYARLEPCTEVGGDLYDVRDLGEGRFALVVGDVVGHGVGAAMLMSNAIACIRALLGELRDPVRIVEKVHEQIYATTEATQYLTLFVGILDGRTHVIEYVNAGHQESPLLLLAGTAPQALDATGPPVGLLPTALSRFELGRAVIEPGALFAAWSDGIPEAHHEVADGQPSFFMDRTPMRELLEAPSASLAAIGSNIFAQVDAFMGAQHAPDDRTLLLLRRGA